MRETFSGIEKQELHNANITLMNADNLGFRDRSFDYVLCGFIGWDYCYDFMRHEFTAPDPRGREIYRVLRNGGRFGLSSWQEQADLDWMQDILIKHFPFIANRQDGERASRPLAYSQENRPGLEEILSSAGFKNIQTFEEITEFSSPDEETWWRQMRNVGWHRYLEEMDAKTLSDFKKIVFDALQAHKTDDGIDFSKTVIFAFGEKQTLSQFESEP